MEKIAVIGIGYVGLTTSLGLAELGHVVNCVDINTEKIELLKQGKSPIYEPQIEELLIKNKEKLSFTISIEEAVKEAKVIYLCVQTPDKENGEANLEYLYQVIDKMIPAMDENKYVVIKSTVPVGTCEEIEKYINKKTLKSIEIEVISNPEFLSQGQAVKDFLQPQRIIIGTRTNKASEKMKEIYKNIHAPILTTSRESSEMIKYAANSFLALKISYINEIANLCEKVGANIEDVEKGIGLDKRIGDKFLKAGIGYGGSCFPKDTKAIVQTAKQNKEQLKTIESAIEINKNQNLRLIEKAKKYYKTMKNRKVAILGATFKPRTDDIRKSPAIKNIDILLKQNANISIYEPYGKKQLEEKYGNKIQYKNTIEETLEEADICFIFTDLEEIKNIDVSLFQEKMKKPIILDGRNCFNIDNVKKYNIIYESIGRTIVKNIKEDSDSIIMPVKKYLEKTIDFAKLQTHKNN